MAFMNMFKYNDIKEVILIQNIFGLAYFCGRLYRCKEMYIFERVFLHWDIAIRIFIT